MKDLLNKYREQNKELSGTIARIVQILGEERLNMQIEWSPCASKLTVCIRGASPLIDPYKAKFEFTDESVKMFGKDNEVLAEVFSHELVKAMLFVIGITLK